MYHRRVVVMKQSTVWVAFFLLLTSFVSVAAFLPSNTRQPSFHRQGSVAASKETSTNNNKPHIIFPGGGIFFYWQAGVVTYLRDQGYDLSATTSTGASAGALTATLAAADVDYYKATELALDMAKKGGVYDRLGGLQGVWGEMIYNWLDELLPENAVELSQERGLSLLVTPVPTFGKEKIDSFRDRKDLIQCNMASIHLPWFLDGKITSNFRDRPYIDGSFLASARDYHPLSLPSKTFVVDFKRDPAYKAKNYLQAVEALSPDGIYQMIEDGKRYAAQLEEQGGLERFPKLETVKSSTANASNNN